MIIKNFIRFIKYYYSFLNEITYITEIMKRGIEARRCVIIFAKCLYKLYLFNKLKWRTYLRGELPNYNIENPCTLDYIKIKIFIYVLRCGKPRCCIYISLNLLIFGKKCNLLEKKSV